MSRVPAAQPPPAEQIAASWTCVGETSTWLKVGLAARAFVVWAKKTCQSNGAESGEVELDPYQVMSTTPGLPATIYGITVDWVLAPVSTWTGAVHVAP